LLRPIKNNVIVELIEKEKTTASGIVLTSADSDEASRGKVLEIGPDVLDIQQGQIVLPNWNKARKTRYDDKEFYVVPENEIVLIFE
jgi:chaperonin GroES